MKHDSTNAGTAAAVPGAAPGKQIGAGKAAVILLIGIAALAFTAPWVKLANFEPATSAILRVGLAAIVLLPFALRERARSGSLNRTGVTLSILSGIFLGIDFTAWNYSIFFVGSGIASILLNLQVIILPALAAVFDKYKVPKSYFVLVPIMIFGVVLSGGVFDKPEVDPTAATHVYGVPIAILGTILGMTSGVCYGIYLYASRKASTVNPGRIVQPMLLTCLAQLVAPSIWALVSGRGLDFTNGVMTNGKLVIDANLPVSAPIVGDPITMTNWFWMLVLAVVGQAVAWTFVQIGSVRLDTTIVAGLLLLSPISTVAFIAPLMFGEQPSLLQWLGVVLVLAAVAYQNGLIQALMRKIKGESAPTTTP
ncbi:hypothetical protein GCM10027030_15700 [Luteococcus sediminum]